VQFSNLRETLLVFASAPMSVVGGVAALAAAGLNFSAPAAIGFLALFGITVMEGIIMMSHLNHLRVEGLPWRRALDQAGEGRMRPVFMTCFASFAGLLPMALATGIGADVWKPFALVVVGGVGLVPVFILVVFPAMIDLFGRSRRARQLERGGRRRRRAGMKRLPIAAAFVGLALAGAAWKPAPAAERQAALGLLPLPLAAGAAPLGLEEAERRLVERNLFVVAARRGVDVTRAQFLVAGSLPPPQVTVGGALAQYAELSRGGRGARFYTPASNVLLGLSVLVERGGKRTLRSRLADEQVGVAEAQVLEALRLQVFQLRQTFLGALLARANLEVALANRQSLDRTEALLRRQWRDGAVPEGDLPRFQASRLPLRPT